MLSTLEPIHDRDTLLAPILNSMMVLADCKDNEYDQFAYSLDMQLSTQEQAALNKCFDTFYVKENKDPRDYFDSCQSFCGMYSITQAT